MVTGIGGEHRPGRRRDMGKPREMPSRDDYAQHMIRLPITLDALVRRRALAERRPMVGIIRECLETTLGNGFSTAYRDDVRRALAAFDDAVAIAVAAEDARHEATIALKGAQIRVNETRDRFMEAVGLPENATFAAEQFAGTIARLFGLPAPALADNGEVTLFDAD